MYWLVICLALFSVPAIAQRPDAKGCQENSVVTRMPGCSITKCETRDFASADMPRTSNERGHLVDGQLERTFYACPKEKSPLEWGVTPRRRSKSQHLPCSPQNQVRNNPDFRQASHGRNPWGGTILLGFTHDHSMMRTNLGKAPRIFNPVLFPSNLSSQLDRIRQGLAV